MQISYNSCQFRAVVLYFLGGDIVDDKKKVKKQQGSCETCEFYEEDEIYGASCSVNLDEDEYARFAEGRTTDCPYYRRYDEYETVRHQN